MDHKRVDQEVSRHTETIMEHLHESAWDALAGDRPFEAVSTVYGKNRQVFWESGKRTADFLMRVLSPDFTVRETVVDFGVGLGRIAFPLATRFKRVIGIDVSNVMLRQLRAEAETRGVTNLHGFHIDESWDDERADFVYSVLTFQHMPDEEVRRALPRLCRVMENGVGYFQFDTRPPRRFNLLRFIPNGLLPWTWRPGMRRITRSSNVIRSWLADAGFIVAEEFKPDSPLHGFLVKPRALPITL